MKINLKKGPYILNFMLLFANTSLKGLDLASIQPPKGYEKETHE